MNAAPEAPHEFKRLSPLTPVVRSFIFVVAAASAMWRETLSGEIGIIGWILLGLVLAGLAYGTVSWLWTKYWIEGDELRVDTGVLNRQSRRLRIDRLQGIDIVQPFVARLFGLAELRMDVAGAGKAEGSLAFLRLAEARALKELLLVRRDEVRNAEQPGEGVPGEAPVREPVPESRVLARLDFKMLVISMLLSGETIGFLVSGLVFLVLFLVTGSFLAGTSILPVVAGFALFQARKLSAFYRFTVTTIDRGVQVQRGLLELTTQTVTLQRVQGIVLLEPWPWRHLGWARLDVSVAGGTSSVEDGDKPSQATVLPVGVRAEVIELGRYLLSGLDPEGAPLTAPPEQAKWVAPIWRKLLAAGVGETVVASRAGLFTRRTDVVPHARVQSLRLHQGPWQRRLGLADVLVDSPAGPVRVRGHHRDAAEARALLEQEQELAARARVPAPRVTREA